MNKEEENKNKESMAKLEALGNAMTSLGCGCLGLMFGLVLLMIPISMLWTWISSLFGK